MGRSRELPHFCDNSLLSYKNSYPIIKNDLQRCTSYLSTLFDCRQEKNRGGFYEESILEEANMCDYEYRYG